MMQEHARRKKKLLLNPEELFTSGVEFHMQLMCCLLMYDGEVLFYYSVHLHAVRKLPLKGEREGSAL